MKNKKGFTLVELLVVVAVIAVIALIAIPAFNKSTQKAEKETCAYNIRSVYSALSTAKLTGDYSTDKDAVADIMQNSFDTKETTPAENYKGLCPSGGNTEFYYIDNELIKIVCSVHGSDNLTQDEIDKDNLFNTILDYVNSYISPDGKWFDKNKLFIEKFFEANGNTLDRADEAALKKLFDNPDLIYGTTKDNLYWRPAGLVKVGDEYVDIKYLSANNDSFNAGWKSYGFMINGVLYKSNKIFNDKTDGNTMTFLHKGFNSVEDLEKALADNGFTKAE